MVGNQKYCPSCGTPNPAEVVFCTACGTKFPVMNFQAPTTNPPIPGAPVAGMPPMPQPARSDFITLSCPNCGGRLQVTADVERFACQYCGHEHIVRRSGGMVSLEPVMRMMTVIQTDKEFFAHLFVANMANLARKMSFYEIPRERKYHEKKTILCNYFFCAGAHMRSRHPHPGRETK